MTHPQTSQRSKVTKHFLRCGAALAAALLLAGCNGESAQEPAKPAATNAGTNPTVELSSNQLGAFVVEPVSAHEFTVRREAVGYIDFDDDLSVQVFPNYQGKLVKTFVEIGADVAKGQPLYTIDSPDLVSAEGNLIGAEATYVLTDKELARAKSLYGSNVGVSQRELEQAINDQQTALGALNAARDGLRVFGKTDAEIDQVISSRKIDPALVVPSPINGRITAMNAPPGYLVQPGAAPAPYSVADLSVKWMFANATEMDTPELKVGQPVEVRVMAYTNRVFTGKIDKVYESVDPNVHTTLVRSEISDTNNDLRPGMLANFTIRVGEPFHATAISSKGVTRESDGTYTAWVTTDRKHFTQRLLKLGMEDHGIYQVLDGLQPGELVVSEGSVFLSNILDMPPSD